MKDKNREVDNILSKRRKTRAYNDGTWIGQKRSSAQNNLFLQEFEKTINMQLSGVGQAELSWSAEIMQQLEEKNLKEVEHK